MNYQALARAIYARKQLLILDDIFSGLDNTTSRAVFQRLLGANGIVRQSGLTVILATNHGNCLPFSVLGVDADRDSQLPLRC